MKKQHDLYVNNLVSDIKAYHRDFSRYINSQKKDTLGIPPLKRRNCSGLAESELEQAEEFNSVSLRMCSTKANIPKSPPPPPLNRSAPFLEEIHVSAEGVTSFLRV